jgi:hypothetical protein
MSQVNITLNTNTIEVNTTNNQIVVTDPTNPNVVNVVQPITTVVEVITSGPQGPPGPSGSINTGSLVTTSSFNAFTSSYNTGSFTGSFTGSLFGTSSFAISSSRAVSSSFAISASFAVSSSISVSSSFAQQAQSASFAISSSISNQTNTLNGFNAATVQQINEGELNSGDYAYIVRAQELEQSKHTTINIYNNLNFI